MTAARGNVDDPNVLDLDAARAAADEANGPLPVVIGGTRFHAARPLPVSVAIAAAAGDVVGMCRGMFGEQTDDVIAAGINIDELKVIIDRIVGRPGGPNASRR